MIRILLMVFISCLFIQDEPTLTWESDYRLEWNDFRASPKRQADVIAVTASGLSFGYTTKRFSTGRIEYEFEVKAHFYPEKSWFLKEHVSHITLTHERLHFDITELHARKFRQRVRGTRFTSNIDNEMDVIHNAINDQLREMQQKYDSETQHSRDVAQQKVWQAIVAEELDKMEGYRE